MIVMAAAFVLVAGAFVKKSAPQKQVIAQKITAFVAENVAPVMKPQREQLDGTLSADERKEIVELRTELREVIKLRKENRIGLLFEDQEEVLTVEQLQALKESRDRFRRIMTRAWAIADRHPEEIRQLLQPAKERKPEWTAGIRSILREGIEQKFLVILNRDLVSRAEQHQLAEYFAPVVFLLWDPEKPFLNDDFLK